VPRFIGVSLSRSLAFSLSSYCGETRVLGLLVWGLLISWHGVVVPGTVTARHRECIVASGVHELWVPTAWGADQFRAAGFGGNAGSGSDVGVRGVDGAGTSAATAASAAATAVRVFAVAEAVDGAFLDPRLARSDIGGSLSRGDLRALAAPQRLWNHSSTLPAAPLPALASSPSASASAAAAAAAAAAAVDKASKAADSVKAASGSDGDDGSGVSDCALEAADPRRARFVAVSVFKWGHRKGWDVLLEAFWRAFTFDGWEDEEEARAGAGNGAPDGAGSLRAAAGGAAGENSGSDGSGPTRRSGAVEHSGGGSRAGSLAAERVVLCLRTSKPRIGASDEVRAPFRDPADEALVTRCVTARFC